MADPQVEDGYTRLANEIIEALMRTNLSSYQGRILWAIWRKTYGYQKKQDWLSNSQLAEMTEIKAPHVSRTVSELITRNIVTKAGNKIAFNKDYTQWRELPKRVTVTPSGNKVTDWGYRSYQSGGTQKKKHIKKETFSSDAPAFRLSTFLLSLIKDRNPQFKDPNLQAWSKHIDLMLRRDERTEPDIAAVIEWCQSHDFWQNNILSTDKLRKQYDRLYMEMKKRANKGGDQ
jgi:phage replication O-like protein O